MDLSAAMPDVPAGMSPAAQALGQLLPQWQWGLGNNVSQALVQSGTPKNVNIAQ
jgi:hypothetical protein